MKQRVFPGGWYADARPHGEFVVLMPDSHLETHAGRLPLPFGMNLLFPRVPPEPHPYAVAGQLHRDPQNAEWKPDTGWRKVGPSYGVSPVIYRAGVLHQNVPANGSQGFRYVDDAGRIWTGDETYHRPDLQVHEYTVLSGGIVVGQDSRSERAIIVGPDGVRRVWTDGRPRFIRASRDGDRIALAAWREARRDAYILWLTVDEIAQLPKADVPTAIEVPRIGRPLWLGWFTFAAPPKPLPGNCDLRVVQGQPRILRTHVGDPIAVYVEGQPDGDVTAVERAIKDGKAHGLPVIAYWTYAAQQHRVPQGADWIGVEAYRRVGETLDAFERRVRAAVARVERAVLIGQCYTSNSGLTTDLASLPPVYARIARDCRNVVGLLVFSGCGRPTGLQDHPEVRPLWEQLDAGIPGTPARPKPTPTPALPKPTPKPQPAPAPAPPAKPTRIALRAASGQYVCAEEGGDDVGRVTATRDRRGPWETFRVHWLSGSTIALETDRGRFLCAELGGGRELVANRTAIGPWERFTLVQIGGRIALKTYNGHYVCAEAGGGRELVADRTAIGPWELFTVEVVR